MSATTVTTVLSSLLTSALALAGHKQWQWSNSFQVGSHWDLGKPPCPGQAVIIPGDVVFLSTEVSLGELELGVGSVLSVLSVLAGAWSSVLSSQWDVGAGPGQQPQSHQELPQLPQEPRV